MFNFFSKTPESFSFFDYLGNTDVFSLLYIFFLPLCLQLSINMCFAYSYFDPKPYFKYFMLPPAQQGHTLESTKEKVLKHFVAGHVILFWLNVSGSGKRSK